MSLRVELDTPMLVRRVAPRRRWLLPLGLVLVALSLVVIAKFGLWWPWRGP